jgi:hypothetical protein
VQAAVDKHVYLNELGKARMHQKLSIEHEQDAGSDFRFVHLQKQIVRLCEAGALVSAYRCESTGQMIPIPREWWNTDRWPSRFDECKINPKQPMANGGYDHSWIFLTSDSLSRCLTAGPKEQVSPSEQPGDRPEATPVETMQQKDMVVDALERWPIPSQPRTGGAATRTTLMELRKIDDWGARGIPMKLSDQNIADRIKGGSASTVRRALGWGGQKRRGLKTG